jgi:Flp pilus assembly protein TadD
MKPDDPDSHYYLGRALLAKDHVAEAREHLETAARLMPADPYVRNALAVAWPGQSSIREPS